MNLVVTGAWADAQSHITKLSESHQILFMQQEKEELPCHAEWVEGAVCNGLFLYHSIEQFVNLRYIQLTSAGCDRVDMDYVQAHGIEIHNARGVYSIPMAEFVVAGVLDIYKGMARFREQQKAHQWTKNRSLLELYGRRVLIVGCGSVGTECAKRFKALGCTVIGVDIAACDDAGYDVICPLIRLDTELLLADVVVLTVPLTRETRHLIDRQRLASIHGVLVNISRGGVVDQAALEQWDGTAVLDVFEEEPLEADSPLWGKENWIITPHNSFVGNGNGERLSSVIMRNLEGTR